MVSGATGASGTSFAAWQNQYFTLAELSNTNTSRPNATSAGDGVVNLLKYEFNLVPKINGTGSLPLVSMTTSGGNTYLTLTYNKVIAATDITYVPEVSGDLATWSSGANNVTAVSVTNNIDGETQTVVVRDLTALNNAGKRFMRMKVTSP